MATVKGTWVFNDVLIEPNIFPLTQLVTFNFVDYTTQYLGFRFRVVSDGTKTFDALYSLDAGSGLFHFNNNTWFIETRKIDFGTTEQEVSDEFYTWLVANAVEVKPKTLKGTWRFNDNPAEKDIAYQDVRFSCVVNGEIKEFMVLGLEPSGYLLYLYTDSASDNEVAYYFNHERWSNDDYRTITFTEEQEVSAEFYEWLTANATKQISKVFKRLYSGDTVATSGTRVFKKLTTENLPEDDNAGLYDAHDNLVASWDTLVNDYGLSLGGAYNSSDWVNNKRSPIYILSTYSELSAGTKLVISNSVTRIGDYAFIGCKSLKEIIIPESVTILDFWSFVGCSNLLEITVPKSVTTFDHGVFNGCTSLKEVTILATATSLPKAMFGGCTSLTSFSIPEGVSYIGDSTFKNCSSLKEVTIPASVERIAERAFVLCPSITDIYYRGTKEQWSAINIINEYGTNDDLLNATIHYNYTG